MPRRNTIVHQTHHRVVVLDGDKWLYCITCGALRPNRPQLPWFQIRDHQEIREWVLKKWGLDPYLFSTNRRKRIVRRAIEGSRVARDPES